MNNRTTQRLVDHNVSRHLAEQERAKEEALSETMPIKRPSHAKLGLWSGLVALGIQLLSYIGL